MNDIILFRPIMEALGLAYIVTNCLLLVSKRRVDQRVPLHSPPREVGKKCFLYVKDVYPRLCMEFYELNLNLIF